MKNLKLILPLLFLSLMFSCDDSESSDINKEQARISVKLVDAPGDFEAVNVEVVDVMIKMDDDSDGDNGWISLESNNKTINLLDLTGGVNEVLVDRFPVPAGTLSQMRLVLGDGNTIVIKNDADVDETFDLKTPSAQQSGLKLKVNAEIEEGYTYDFVIDFDVEKSIVIAGNSGNIILKPVLYVSTEISSGIIQGTVTPADVPSMASILVDDKGTPEVEDDFIISALTDDTGAFSLWGVPAGTYDVIVTPLNEASEYAQASVEDVVVTNGDITTISDPIELMMKPGSIKGNVTNDIVVALTLKVKDGEDVIVNQDSNANGEFTLENIAMGDYTLTVSAAGFVSQEIDVTVNPGLETVMSAITLVAVP